MRTSEELEGQFVPKPLAAYRLGLLSWTLRVWQDLFWDMPEYGTEQSISLAVEQLEETLVALADEINPGVLLELRRELKDVSHLHDLMVTGWHASGTYLGHHFGDRPVPGAGHWRDVLSLADRALSRKNGEMLAWNRLGAAVGKYQFELHRHEDPRPLPELRPVVHSVQSMPPETYHLIPELGTMVALAPQLKSLKPVPFLCRVLGPTFKSLDEKAALYDLKQAILMLDSCIQDRLKQVQGPLTPRWGSRKLWYGDILCKEYKRPAPDQELILNSFQELGWPKRIDDPLPPEKLKDTIKDLQKALCTSPIVIERDGTGKGITWRPRELP